VEEQRTNLVLRSEEFETTWSAGNVTVTSNNIAAPNGTVTAEKITDSVDVSNNAHQLTQGVAVLSGVAYTVSAFIKAGNGVGFSLGAGSVGAFATEQRVLFDASTGVATSQLGTPTNITMTAVGDGWYRCSCSITPTSSATATIVVRLYNSAASGFYIGDGTQFAYVWGAQLEAGAFPTSYIPTTTATVTRSADVCSISGSNFSAWFNATQSTIYSEAASSTGAAYTGYVYTIGASFNDSITHYRQSDSQPVARIRTASADEYGATGNGAIWTGTSVNRFALGVSTTSGRQSSNGTLSAGADDTSITFPAMSSMTIGALVGGSLALNGHLRRLTYWPTRLPNSTLQAVTQ
jgi:hypothetical protein